MVELAHVGLHFIQPGVGGRLMSPGRWEEKVTVQIMI